MTMTALVTGVLDGPRLQVVPPDCAQDARCDLCIDLISSMHGRI
jgi:hypothetical protein